MGFVFYYTIVIFSLSCFTLLTITEPRRITWRVRFWTMVFCLPMYGRVFGWW